MVEAYEQTETQGKKLVASTQYQSYCSASPLELCKGLRRMYPNLRPRLPTEGTIHFNFSARTVCPCCAVCTCLQVVILMLKDAAYEGRDVLTPAQLQLHRLPLFILRLDDDVPGALQAAACIHSFDAILYRMNIRG